MKGNTNKNKDDDYYVDVDEEAFGDMSCEAHHLTQIEVENGDQGTLGGSALSPSNREELTDEQATLASDALAGRDLTEEELEKLKDLFRDGTIEPGDDVKSDWEDGGEA